ncbi:MAG TPA: 4-(cytidine 5'-diphospho)-2-C-methyl-D-erythritol kinase [Candidatus Omnitrophica bacterium]|nr:4-(cytidine 5'-diphospho)-2-C-methyl-D-erythritol kinase [Candidatus Omnitrophota bacterium]
MNKLTLQSPAKVNLYLRIVGRRPDGYHKLDTLFHRLSLADTLTLKKQKADFSFSSNAKLPAREGNLLFKAYVELQKKFPKLGGVHANLVKRIPIGAGLGGGSSNAAFFLLGMAKLYGLKISQAGLMKIGVRVGADVPFFLLQKNQARALGIGEKLKQVPSKKKRYFLLLTDPKPLSTPAVYKKYREQNGGFSKKSADLNESVNDLQPAALSLRPSIEKRLNALTRYGAETVLLSGSGPTVFAVSDSQAKIKKLYKSLAVALRKRVILCHSL